MPDRRSTPLSPDDEDLLRRAGRRLVDAEGGTPPATAASLARAKVIARRRRIVRYSATAAIAAAVVAAIVVPISLAAQPVSHLVPAHHPPSTTVPPQSVKTVPPSSTTVPPPSTTAPTTAPTTTLPPSTTTTTTSPTQPVAVAVQVVVCPTTFGISPPPAPKSLPGSQTVTLPEDLSGHVSLYSDTQGTMTLLGPSGWQCRASYGADGSGGVSVYPPGETLLAVPHPSNVQGIVGSETSACFGCRLGQACPLFPAAAAARASNGFTSPCPSKPPSESVVQLSSGVVAFTDPPGVAGDAALSGGAYPASGVMTYYTSGTTGSSTGSWVDSCTLPTAERPVCTAALNLFLFDYGSK